MNFKPSQYNYVTEDKNGDYLICNLAIGMPSLRRIKKHRKKVVDYLLGKEANIDLTESEVDLLNGTGLIVNSSINELHMLKAMHTDLINANKLNLIIMTTGQCNFRCKYCYEDFKQQAMDARTQKALLKLIQKQLNTFSQISIEWFGGEPLMGLNVIKSLMPSIVQMCNNKKASFRSGMTTNGYMLSPVVFDELYNLRIFDYQITLDGAREQHDKQRVLANGSGTYDVIVNNLLYIKNNKDKYPKANIVIRVNITADIAQHLEDFLAFCKINFSGDRRFSVLFKEAGDLGGDSNSLFKETKLLKNYSNLIDVLKKHNVYDSTDIDINSAIDSITPLSSVCYASFKNSYVIGPTGDLYKCTVHFNNDENKIGTLTDNGDMAIDRYKHSLWYFGPTKNVKKCDNCKFLPVCFGGGCTYATNIKKLTVCNKDERNQYAAMCMNYIDQWINIKNLFGEE